MNLMEHLESAQKSLFRFECLQDYNIPEEKKLVNNYIKTGEVDLTSIKEWFNFIKRKVSSGVKVYRVRLIKYTLTDYTKMSIAIYKKQILECGDEIKTIIEKDFNKLNIPEKDFYLVDDKFVVLMKYNDSFEFIGFEVIKDKIKEYISYKDKLLKNSQSVKDFSL